MKQAQLRGRVGRNRLFNCAQAARLGVDCVNGRNRRRVLYTKLGLRRSAWKGFDGGVDEVFPRLDLDGDGYLSRAEFGELWADFWRGDDPASPGQWVFGPF